MRETLVDLLQCPLCASADLALTVHVRDEREIREGELVCESCGAQIPIHRGVVRALLNPPPQVAAEAIGWVDLLDIPEKQHEFRDDWILALPFIRPEQTPEPDSVQVWHQVGRHFFDWLDRFDWQGQRVLEIGAGRCWGVAELARRGAYAVGLDILSHKYLGLETADVWLLHKKLYFERVLGDMHQLPFRPDVFDYVITTASLHHTDRLEVVLREAARVLTPMGRALFLNEPVIADYMPRPDLTDSPEVARGIIESRPFLKEWLGAFRSAGFYVGRISFDDGLHVLLNKDVTVRSAGLSTRVVVAIVRKWATVARAWMLELARRAPSAPRYYWGTASEAVKRGWRRAFGRDIEG